MKRVLLRYLTPALVIIPIILVLSVFSAGVFGNLLYRLPFPNDIKQVEATLMNWGCEWTWTFISHCPSVEELMAE